MVHRTASATRTRTPKSPHQYPMESQPTLTSRRAARGYLLLFAMLALGVALIAVSPRGQLLALGMLVLLIVAFPMLRLRTAKAVEPWIVIALIAAVGITTRMLAIAVEWPDPDSVDRILLRGLHPSQFIWPSLFLALGLAAMAAGYTLSPRPRRRLQTNDAWSYVSPRRVYGLIAIVLLIGFGSFLIYALNTGGLDPASISDKRTIITRTDIQHDTEYRGHGYLLVFARLAGAALVVLLAWSFNRRKRPPVIFYGLLLMLGALSWSTDFYASVRTPILLLPIQAGLVWLYYRRWSVRRVIALALVASLAIAVFSVMTDARHSPQFGIADTLESLRQPTLLRGVVLNRNLGDVSAFVHLSRAVPQILDQEWGATYASWLAAPIPRELWPEKPLVNSGPIIGRHLYGMRGGGVPPGLFGELYWNFLLPGMIAGGFLVGVGVRFLWLCIDPGAGGWLNIALYVWAFPPALLALLQNSLGAGIITLVVGLTQVLIVFVLLYGTRLVSSKPPLTIGRPLQPTHSRSGRGRAL